MVWPTCCRYQRRERTGISITEFVPCKDGAQKWFELPCSSAAVAHISHILYPNETVSSRRNACVHANFRWTPAFELALQLCRRMHTVSSWRWRAQLEPASLECLMDMEARKLPDMLLCTW